MSGGHLCLLPYLWFILMGGDHEWRLPGLCHALNAVSAGTTRLVNLSVLRATTLPGVEEGLNEYLLSECMWSMNTISPVATWNKQMDLGILNSQSCPLGHSRYIPQNLL